MKMVTHELNKALNVERHTAHATLTALVHKHDYSAYGGAPLLGIDGICIICHGSSGDRAIKNAIQIAAQYARAGLNEKIVQELAAAPAMADGEE
jgi:glycerol-3-phosphate acyltransferase PlsX